MAYDLVSPIGDQRGDYQIAQLIEALQTFFYTFLSSSKPPKTKISDFLLRFKIPEESDISHKLDQLCDRL